MSTRQTYTNLDFDTIMANLRRWMKGQDEFKDYDFEGASITQLMRLLSYNTEQMGYTSNMLFNELHLDTAEQRNNAASVASLLSYTPGSVKASRMVVDVIVTPPDAATAEDEIVMKRDTRFLAVSDGTAFSFVPDNEYTAVLGADGNYTFKNVTLLQGTWVVNTFDVVGSGIDVYEIPNANIDIDTLDISVQVSATVDTLNTFNRYQTPYDLGGQNGLYYLSLARTGFYQLEFGDDQLSKKLEDGNIVVARYLVTDGVAGNGLKGLSAASTIDGISSVAVSEISARSTGGADPESIGSIRKIAPVSFRTGGAAVVDSDYTVITKQLFPEAQDVISWGGEDNTPKKYGYTFVAVKPRSSETLTDAQKAQLVQILKKHNVGSMTPIIVDPAYYYLNITSRVKYNSSKTTLDSASLKKKVSDYVKTFSAANLEQFDRSFDLSQLTSFIKNIDRSFSGNVTDVEYEKHLVPELNFAGAYSILFNKALKPGSVSVTNFTVSDAETGYSYKILDDGLGALILWKTRGSSTVSMGPAGSVAYDTGTVNLVKFRPNSIVGPVVIVRCRSSSYDQDLQTLRGDILKVNTVSVELEATNA
uniref:Baseplate wedge subunit n=1 Tax=Pseudomonas phage Cygsa01 TaxID=3138529 RepID=A0AAU6W314_9VIRU